MTFHAGTQTYRALSAIDLDIPRGQIYLLMGPSGSGKTTLISILAGILTPTAGQVYLMGQNITSMTRMQLAQFRLQHIGFIFQSFNLFPALTSLENIELALNTKGIRGQAARSEALALLEKVELADYANLRPQQLSGGQKQRVAIARALAGQSHLIMADEPTAALDSRSGRLVVEKLHQLAKQIHCTVLIVTHDPRIIDVADQIIYLKDGMIPAPAPDER